MEAAATIGVVAFLGAIGFLIYKNWNNIADTLMSPFKVAEETGEQIREDVTTFPDKVIGAIKGTQESCAYLKGVLADVPYNACMAVYGRFAPFDPLPPINEAQQEQMENPNYNVDSPCSLNPATGGFICPDPAVPTEVPQEAINAAWDYTHEQATQMRADMGIVLQPETYLNAGVSGCFGGRRVATQEEYNRLLVGPVMGCGRSVNPMTGEGYFYCDC